jgi:muramidase (phage lysozyme)
MNERVMLIAGLSAGAAVAWWMSQRDDAAPESGGVADVLGSITETIAAGADVVTGGLVSVSRMSSVTPGHLSNRNVQAMLRVIRQGEGTADAAGYSRLFGGGQFSGFADHPRLLVKKGGYSSTAAGAYQFLSSTWDETAKAMGLTDFSPASQDMGAVGRLAARGALADVVAGRFEAAVKKINREWASLPGSPYGQPVLTWDRARAVFADAGGGNYA